MSRRITRRNVQRRQLSAELLEDRRLLAVVDLLPALGGATEENGTTIVTASGGSTVRFEATLTSAEQAVRGYQLNFANSANSLVIDEFLQSEAFPEFIDAMINREQGDSIVSSSAETAISAPPTRSLGTFDVMVPLVAGDYRLTINSAGVAQDHRTLVVDAEANSLPITDYGDVILRVSDASETVVTMTTEMQSQLEDAGTVSVNVSLSQVSNEDVIVPFTLSGTATEGTDFTVLSSPLTIPAGSMSADIEFTLIDDLAAESAETIVVTLSTPIGARLGADVVHTLHIVDNDDGTPTAVLSLESPTVQENAGTVNMTVTLSSASEFDVTIPYTVSGSATRDTDFVITPDVIMIPSGQTTATLEIAVTDDFQLENNETVIVRLDPPTNAKLGSPNRQVLTIIDNDQTPPPTVSFRTAALTVGESVGSVSLDVFLSAASDAPITVPLTVSGTATPNTDFTISPNQITFAAGQISASIIVNVIDDTAIEGNETVIVTLGTPTGALLGEIPTKTLTISDDDKAPPPKINIVNSAIRVEEGNKVVIVTVSLSEPTETFVEVPFTITGTATTLKDYASLTDRVGFAAGQVLRSFKLHIFEDNLAEEEETMIVTLGTPNLGELGDVTSTTITIVDNDLVGDYPKVSFSTSQMMVSESNPLVWVTATLSILAPEVIKVPITVTSTATDGSDYVLSQRMLVFERGSSTAALPIEIVNDDQIESTENIVLTILPPEGLNLGENPTQTISIFDNDSPLPNQPSVGFSTTAQSVNEDDGTISVAVVLTSPSDHDVLIPFVATGTARNGHDFTISASPLLIAAGRTSGTIVVNVIDDKAVDPDETVSITLQTPTGATLGNSITHTITIVDSDSPLPSKPTVNLTEVTRTVSEGDGAITVSVKLSKPSEDVVLVPFRVYGSAIQGSDFTIASNAFTIAPGETTASVTINLIDDTIFEGVETVTVSLDRPTGAKLGSSSTFTGTILDNDADQGDTIVRNPMDRANVIVASSRSTAVLFSATENTELLVGFVETASATTRVRLYDGDMNQIASEAAGLLRASLTADASYALIFEASPVDQTIFVRSSAGANTLSGASINNLVEPTDVDGSGETTTLDALRVVNQLSRQADGESVVAGGLYYDVNADGRVSALDALQVINYLSRNAANRAQEELPGVVLSNINLGSDSPREPQAIPVLETKSPSHSGAEGEALAPQSEGALPELRETKESQIDAVIADIDDALQLLD